MAKINNLATALQASAKGKSSESARETTQRTTSTGSEKKALLVRIAPEGIKALKVLASEQGITLQDLLKEAANDVLVKYGKLPLA